MNTVQDVLWMLVLQDGAGVRTLVQENIASARILGVVREYRGAKQSQQDLFLFHYTRDTRERVIRNNRIVERERAGT